MAALVSSMRPESKVLTKLEKEVEWLEGEKRQLEAHITRTEVWADNLGKWRAYVQSAEVNLLFECPIFKYVYIIFMELLLDKSDIVIKIIV